MLKIKVLISLVAMAIFSVGVFADAQRDGDEKPPVDQRVSTATSMGVEGKTLPEGVVPVPAGTAVYKPSN